MPAETVYCVCELASSGEGGLSPSQQRLLVTTVERTQKMGSIVIENIIDPRPWVFFGSGVFWAGLCRPIPHEP